MPDTVRSITVLKNTCGVSQAASSSSVLPSCLLCMRNRSRAQGHNSETGFYAGLTGYLKNDKFETGYNFIFRMPGKN